MLQSSIQKNARKLLIKKIELEESQKCIKNYDINFFDSIVMSEIKSMPIYEYTIQNIIENDVFLTPNIYTAFLQNVIYYVERNSIFTDERKLIADSVMNHFKPEKYSFLKLYFSKQETISGLCSVFRSIFSHNNYYHTLIDYLPRIYLLEQYQRERGKSEKIKLLIPGDLTKVENFFLSKLLPENIEILHINANKLYRVESLILPSFLTRKNCGYLPKSYLAFFHEKVLPKQPRNKKNLIYISRKFVSANSKRCILNEDKLLNRLEPYGFKSYNLENMSIEEQIMLFYNASFVISPHGAGLANLIFAEAINVLELFPGTHLLPHYYFLSKSLGHNYTYWCAQTEMGQDANFRADIDKIVEIVENIL